ncbi:hypothetical protein [Frankia sp. EAN1pec]|uniref:hypothetical protein n=1 Tax=Parafrankia sp. (strain EAN1pec) TaxID=298653 RepID=UPI0012F9430D
MADVLQSSVYPDGFPHQYRLLYRPDSMDLVIDYELPTTDVIPEQRSFRYVKKTDEITVAARPVRERRDLYRSLVAQIALRPMREVFDGEGTDILDTVVFNGHFSTIDRATGQEIQPCLVSVSATREEFTGLVLAQVDPTEYLRRLNALVSPHPYDLEPVRPVGDWRWWRGAPPRRPRRPRRRPRRPVGRGCARGPRDPSARRHQIGDHDRRGPALPGRRGRLRCVRTRTGSVRATRRFTRQ